MRKESPQILLDYAMPKDEEVDHVLELLCKDLMDAGYHAERREKDPRTIYCEGMDILILLVAGTIISGFLTRMGEDLYEAGKKAGWGPVKRSLMNLRRNLARRHEWFRIHLIAEKDPTNPDSILSVEFEVYDWKHTMTDDEWEACLGFFSSIVFPSVHGLVSKGNKRRARVELHYDEEKWEGVAVVENDEPIWLNLDLKNRKIIQRK